MKKKYIVALKEEEREELRQITKKGKSPAYRVNHAYILLKADSNQKDGGWNDREISEALGLGHSTIERVRQRFVEEGMESALGRKEQAKSKAPSLNGEQEAHLIALACSQPPSGQGRWTLRLLAEKMVELSYVASVSHETVRKTLKKMNCNHGNRNAG